MFLILRRVNYCIQPAHTEFFDMEISMVRFILLSVVSLAISTSGLSLPARALSIGPMWHWNFGGDKNEFSWALEVAYWQTYGNPPSGTIHLHGIDFGIEFQNRTRRIYCEYQRGEVVYGASIGLVLEFNKARTNFGIQGSTWGAFFAGVDFRLRYVLDKGTVIAPGAFLKLPVDLNDGDYGQTGR